MKKSIIILMLVCLIIPMINAEIQTLGTAKQGDCISLKQSYYNSTYTNITSIQYPNKTSTNVNYAMTRDSFGNYNYSYCNTNTLGQYIITTTTDVDGVPINVNYDFTVTPTGTNFNTVQISIYIFFFILCLVITFFSFKLFKENKFSKDGVKGKDLYEMKKRNEFMFYMQLLKGKLWIVGAFGIYLSILLFVALLSQLVYNLGLTDINSVLLYIVIGFTWGLIPFTIFWFVWLIITFYKSTEEILKYQFGNFGSKK